ncbi:serine/threonine protein kinase [Amycolatopsis arida]|uniref:non-specific serine/threonine protein kinase n=1 Tax=Amycolatopsis arida TaxID=587909 RepID=A0A1I5TW18_9PSEU|nr:serine/threonine-protein kinase [Amycolatopsis arida]TDX95942.1 serine/threonine-protein kinase [Amycolatopsis arida]SFP87280.1 serine/threonine protein kinase [Amycolatopsis arida]
MLSSGQLLADRYRLANRIAVGGMGEVWAADDTRLDRTVAVKVLKAELSGDAEFLHRFRTEARTTASLNHPGIAGVHDYGETVEPGTRSADGSGEPQHIAYLVMELVAGEPLAGILAREGRLSADRTLDVLEQAGHALQAAHERGLVHRDVKPGNILVTPTGQVKITDFGVAKAADAVPVTRSGMVMGTAHYIAPEQALGHDAEPTSDVYSLAVCGYECLAGHRPFLSENAVTVAMMHIRDLPPPLPPDVPPHARAVIEATLVKDPRQRYRNGGEFAAAVAAVRAGRPLPAPVGLAASHAPRYPPVSPAPMAPVGPGSHPTLQPVTPPGSGPLPHPGVAPPPPRRRGHVALWVVLTLVIVLLVVGLALVLPALLRADDSGDGPTRGGEVGFTPAPEQNYPPGAPERDETDSTGTEDNWWDGRERQPGNDGGQGMMGTGVPGGGGTVGRPEPVPGADAPAVGE